MKKLYSKFLLLALLSFSFVQRVLAEETEGEINFGLVYGEGTGLAAPDPRIILSGAVRAFVLLPLALFSTITIVTFLYLKLRKRDTAKTKSLLRLGGLSLLTIAFLGLTLLQLKNLDYGLSLTDAMLDDKIFSISAALSVLSLLAFIYYLLRTIVLSIARKLKQRKKKIIP